MLKSESTYIKFENDEEMDAFMASATHTGKPKGVDPEMFSKIWRIGLEIAKKTVNITSQNCGRTENTSLSRNYSTNNKNLRYKHIKQYFYMDSFFVTNKVGVSSRRHTCVQLFVTDKGFSICGPNEKGK